MKKYVSTNEFIENYKNLEKKLRRKYKIPDEDSVRRVFNNPELRIYSSSLFLFSDIRNLVSHIPASYVEKFLLISPNSIERIKEIGNSLRKKPRINSFAVPLKEIVTSNYNENVSDGIKLMRNKNINSLVFMENDCITGLFRYKTLMEKFREGEMFIFDTSTKFEELKEYIDLTYNALDILFVHHTDYASSVFEKLKRMREQQMNIDFIILTTNGKIDGKFVGLFTPQRYSKLIMEN